MAWSNAALGEKTLGLDDEWRLMDRLRCGNSFCGMRRLLGGCRWLLGSCRRTECEMEREPSRSCNAKPGETAHRLPFARSGTRCPQLKLRAIAF
jgi:hypothetical protein